MSLSLLAAVHLVTGQLATPGGALIYDGTKRRSRNVSIYYLITGGQQFSVLGDIFVRVSRRLRHQYHCVCALLTHFCD